MCSVAVSTARCRAWRHTPCQQIPKHAVQHKIRNTNSEMAAHAVLRQRVTADAVPARSLHDTSQQPTNHLAAQHVLLLIGLGSARLQLTADSVPYHNIRTSNSTSRQDTLVALTLHQEPAALDECLAVQESLSCLQIPMANGSQSSKSHAAGADPVCHAGDDVLSAVPLSPIGTASGHAHHSLTDTDPRTTHLRNTEPGKTAEHGREAGQANVISGASLTALPPIVTVVLTAQPPGPMADAALNMTVGTTDASADAYCLAMQEHNEHIEREVCNVRAACPTAFIIVHHPQGTERASLRSHLFLAGANMVTPCRQHLITAVNKVASQHGTGKLVCPWCGLAGLTSDDLWTHTPLYHIYEPNVAGLCPSCGHHSTNLAVHIHEMHNPAGAQVEVRTGIGAVIVVHRKLDNKFLCVQEFARQGFWVPGGGLDQGESLREGALRECREEAGVEVELQGVLGVEMRQYPDFLWRLVTFYGVPIHDISMSAPPTCSHGSSRSNTSSNTATVQHARPCDGSTPAGGNLFDATSSTDGQAHNQGTRDRGGGHGAHHSETPDAAYCIAEAEQIASDQIAAPHPAASAHGATTQAAVQAALPPYKANVSRPTEENSACQCKSVPDFESAGACWVHPSEVASLPWRDSKIPKRWFAAFAEGTAVVPPLCLPEDVAEYFQDIVF